MIKTVKNLTLAAALLGACSAMADTKVELSGDAEITYKSEETTPNSGAKTKNGYNETEVNINIDAENQDGVKFHATFVAYDGVQAISEGAQTRDEEDKPTANMATKEAYISAPLAKGAILSAGLMPNNSYGPTDAFDNGGENWKTAIAAPLGESGWKAKLVMKKANEEKQDDGKGDSDVTVLRVDGSAAGFDLGVKHANALSNKDTSTTAGDATNEMDYSALSAYAAGSVAGFDTAFEYISNSGDKDGSGFLVSASKSFGDLSAGFIYLSVADGQDGGSELEPVETLTGAEIVSTKKDDASAFVIPVSYAINDKLTAGVTYLSVSDTTVGGTLTDADELALSAEYALGEVTTLTAVYSSASVDKGDDTKVMSIAVATEF